MAFFSIVIPVYNVELYLDRCLESVIKQTFSDYEIILVDDGSTDGSGAICDKYGAQLPNCTIIHQKNKGLSVARNTGLSESKGEYVYFLDSDDAIEATLFDELNRVIEKNHDIDVVGFDAQIIEEGKANEKLTTSNGINGIQHGLSFSEKATPKSTVPLYCYKREFLIQNDLFFYEGIYYEDLLFTAQVFLKNPKVIMLGKSYYMYYKRQGSITTTYTKKKNYEDMLLIIRELLAESKECEKGQLDAFRNIYKSYLMLSEEVYSCLSKKDKCIEKDARKIYLQEAKGKKELIGTSNMIITMFPGVFYFIRNIRRTLIWR